MEEPEREMPLIQRDIVDNCFEEGHYEYGIGILDRLRTHGYRPFPLHVRQLVFISLYQPRTLQPSSRVDAPPPSPLKVPIHRQKDDIWPKPTSRPPAIALLNAFLNTNSPASLMRGLPYYSYRDDNGVSDIDPFLEYKTTENEFEDNSVFKTEVLAMQQLKDCWELLRGGLIKRIGTRARSQVDSDPHTNDIVGLYAWPVLDWLINVFEKDEMLAAKQGLAPHSGLLLCQIPPPRSKKGPRWDADGPLNVAFACFLSDHEAMSHEYVLSKEKRVALGTRLIILLANLTMTTPPLLSPSHFLRSLVQRLPQLPISSFEALLAYIPPRHITFKIALLEGCLEISGRNSDNHRPIEMSTVPAPRAKPKFNGRGAAVVEMTTVVMPSSSQDKNKEAYQMQSTERFLELIASPLSSLSDSSSPLSPTLPLQACASSMVNLAFAKLQLISALLTLHITNGVVNTTDMSWIAAVRAGRVREAVQSGFMLLDRHLGNETEGKTIKEYQSQALENVSLWEAS